MPAAGSPNSPVEVLGPARPPRQSLPLWLQQWMGYTTIAAGFALAPVGVLAIVLTPLSGRKVAVSDPRWMVTLSFVIFCVVLSLRANFTSQTDFGPMSSYGLG